VAAKTTLTTEEIYKAAYLHHVLGVEQHVLSVAYSVNVGRISEACAAMEYAAGNVRAIYQMAKPREPQSNLPEPLDAQMDVEFMPRVLRGGPARER
jgi:hypothetical protein